MAAKLMTGRKNKELPGTLTDEIDGQSSVSVGLANVDAFKERMKVLIGHFKAEGGVAEIARRCGLSEAVIRSWRDGSSDPSRSRCIQLAGGTGCSLAWLVAGSGPTWESDVAALAQQIPSQALRRDDLMLALQLAAEALGEKSLPPEKHAELVTLIYELLEEGLPEAKVLRFARAAAP